MLLDNGASIGSQDNFQHTPLYCASCYGYERVVRMLLVKGANADGVWSLNPLVGAAAGGHEQVVQILLDKGAKTDVKWPSGETALSWAARNGHEKAVQILLENEADVNNKGI